MKVPLIEVHVPEIFQNAANLHISIALQLFADLESVYEAFLRLIPVLVGFIPSLDCLHSIVVPQSLQQ